MRDTASKEGDLRMPDRVSRKVVEVETGIVRAGESWSDAELIREHDSFNGIRRLKPGDVVETDDPANLTDLLLETRRQINRRQDNPGIQRRECEHEPDLNHKYSGLLREWEKLCRYCHSLYIPSEE